MIGLISIATSSIAAPFFEFTGASQRGDFIGAGQTYFRDQSFGTVSINVSDLTGDGQPDYVDTVMVGNVLGQFMSVIIGTNQLGRNLLPGLYSNAERAPFASAGHPGLQVDIDGRGCNTLTGSFLVNDIAFVARNTLDRLDVSFEQHCEGAVPAFIGRFRYDRTNPLPRLVADVPALGPFGLIVLATLLAALAIPVFRRRALESRQRDPLPHSARKSRSRFNDV